MGSILPLTIGDEKKSPYAGFWPRTGAHLFDMLILGPYFFIIYYLEKINYFFLIFFFLFAIAFHFFWTIYLLKRFGGTPGKLICGVIVIRKDGKPVSWREAFLRNIVDFPYGIYGWFISIWIIHKIGYDVFQALSLAEYGKLMGEKTHSFIRIIDFAFQTWFWGELIVLLFNKRKRAIHDFIAGTVVIKKKMLPQIEMHIGPSPNHSLQPTASCG